MNKTTSRDIEHMMSKESNLKFRLIWVNRPHKTHLKCLSLTKSPERFEKQRLLENTTEEYKTDKSTTIVYTTCFS